MGISRGSGALQIRTTPEIHRFNLNILYFPDANHELHKQDLGSRQKWMQRNRPSGRSSMTIMTV